MIPSGIGESIILHENAHRHIVVRMRVMYAYPFAPFGRTHGTFGLTRPLLDADVMRMRSYVCSAKNEVKNTVGRKVAAAVSLMSVYFVLSNLTSPNVVMLFAF